MDAYAASLARKCLDASGIEHFYTGNVPEGFMFPALYFPPAEERPGDWSFGSYETVFSIYAKIFARTREEAMELAGAIAESIMEGRRLIPLLDRQGDETGVLFKTDPPETKPVDEGVAQITLSWRRVRAYREEVPDWIAQIGINQRIRGT